MELDEAIRTAIEYEAGVHRTYQEAMQRATDERGRRFFEVLRDETRKLSDQALWAQVQDITAAAFEQKVWDAAIAQIKDAGKSPITSNNLPKVVEVVTKQFKLSEGQQAGVAQVAGGFHRVDHDIRRQGFVGVLVHAISDNSAALLIWA